MDSTKIGLKIREYRNSLELTQEEAAAKANLATRAFQRLESGSSNPTLETLVAVAKALECEVVDLLSPKQRLAHAMAKQASRPQWDPSPEELARVLHYLRHSEPVTRLSALVMLTGLEEYKAQLRAIPDGAPFASVLEKIPRRS